MLIGKIKFYNDNMDVYTIKACDGKTYYGMGKFNIDDVVTFDYHVLNTGEYETLVALNIEKVDVKKLILK